jgi:hypothetical protein
VVGVVVGEVVVEGLSDEVVLVGVEGVGSA